MTQSRVSSCFFQRHFAVFAVHFPGADALATIFSSILSAHFLQGGFSYGVSRSVGTLIQVHPRCDGGLHACPSVSKHCVSYGSAYPGSYLSAPENQPELPPHSDSLSLHLQPARSLQHFPGNTHTCAQRSVQIKNNKHARFMIFFYLRSI